MIKTLQEAEEFVKFHRLVMLAPELPLPSLVSEVAGEDLKGGWWGHDAAHLIFALYTDLRAHPDVLTAKLIDGKITFVHRALWPSLLRVVTDVKWRRMRRCLLLDESRVLLNLVRRHKLLRMSRATNIAEIQNMNRKTLKRAKKNLEKSVLVRADQAHTDKGRHETIFEAWGHWCDCSTKQKYQILSYDEAVYELDVASIGRMQSILYSNKIYG